jgi:hypothetical protein
MAVAFLLVALGPSRFGHTPRWWALAVSGVFALVGPKLLSRVNWTWTKLCLLLGKVLSPISLGILFYGVLIQLSVVIRLTGKDPLRLKFDPRRIPSKRPTEWNIGRGRHGAAP